MTTTTTLQRAERPAVSIQKSATLAEAVALMVDAHVGALVVLERGCAVGIVSALDVLSKVVLDRRAPAPATVASVMTAPVFTIQANAPLAEAVALMSEHGVRHLPVAEWDGRIVGMLSQRHLERDEIDDLKNTVNSLEAYASYDGATG